MRWLLSLFLKSGVLHITSPAINFIKFVFFGLCRLIFYTFSISLSFWKFSSYIFFLYFLPWSNKSYNLVFAQILISLNYNLFILIIVPSTQLVNINSLGTDIVIILYSINNMNIFIILIRRIICDNNISNLSYLASIHQKLN